MLERGEGDGIAVCLAGPRRRIVHHDLASRPLDDLDSVRKPIAVDLHHIVGKLPSRRVIVEPTVDLAEFAIDVAADPDPLKQCVCRRIAQRIRVLEGDGLARCHLTAQPVGAPRYCNRLTNKLVQIRNTDSKMTKTRLALSMSCCDYDRCHALVSGRVAVDGVDLVISPNEPEESFHRAFQYQEFDVTELSLSSFTLLTSRDEAPYVGIPAFVSRLFRHSGIYIRTDRGIDDPSKLSGRKIGLPEYQITANVWIRGILEEEYGVRPESITWWQGGLEEAGREERAPLLLPPEIDMKPIPRDRTLSEMLERGEVDALISARAPSCFLRGAAHVQRMFPDFKSAEQDYYKRTKIFPIMHLIGLRRSIYEKHPWVAVNLFKAFIESKQHAMYELGQIGHLFSSLPWSVAEFQQTRALMGQDFWPYGVDANRAVLDRFLDYHYRQGLSQRRVQVDELFAPSTMHLTKI